MQYIYTMVLHTEDMEYIYGLYERIWAANYKNGG